MLGIDGPEFILIAVVALVVIGPKDLPRVMRQAGQWMSKAKDMARQFRSGFDAMVQEAELDEMREQARKTAMAVTDPMSGIREAIEDATSPATPSLGVDTKVP